MLHETLVTAVSTRWISRIDSRVRLFAFILLTLTIAFLQNITAITSGFSVATLLLFSLRYPVKALVTRLTAVNVFIVFMWLILPWSTPGDPLLTLGPIPITYAGVLLAGSITLKANAAFFIFLVFVASMRVTELIVTLRRLGISDKLTALLLFTLRGIALFESEYRHLRDAAKLRAFEPRLNSHTYHTQAAFVVALIIRAMRRARHMDEAMRLRGFDGVIRLLEPEQMPFKACDYLTLGLSMLFATAVLTLEFNFWNLC